jgi:hypothetical protein
MSVLGEAYGIEVRHAGLERVTHRADSGPMSVGPAFERATEEDRQSPAARPTKIGGQPRLRRAGMNAELIHLTILRAPTVDV